MVEIQTCWCQRLPLCWHVAPADGQKATKGQRADGDLKACIAYSQQEYTLAALHNYHCL